MSVNLRLSGAYYNGKSRVYYYFSHGSSRLSFSGVYSISQQRIQSLREIGSPATDDGSHIQAAEVFKTTDNEVFWYVQTNNRIGVLAIDSRDNTGKFQKKETHAGVYVVNDNIKSTSNTTMAMIGGYPYLAGGTLGTTGYQGTWVALQGTYPHYYRYNYLNYARDNPIIQRFRNKIYYIGGNRIVTDPFVEYAEIYFNKPTSLLGANYIYTKNNSQHSVYLIEDFSELYDLNNLFAKAASYRDDLYIFTKKTFLNEGVFYRYSTYKDTFTLYKADSDICRSINLNNIDSIQVTNVNNLLQIALSHYENSILRCEIVLFRPHF